MDHALTQKWMEQGLLPNFAALAAKGHFQALKTTNPAQSPVAWSSFATGLNPGEHGIFDFIRRDAATYHPDFSIAELEPGEHWDVLGLRIPTKDASLSNRRRGKPFWITAEQRGNPSTILRVPVTFPPDNVHRMLSGMGVPDLIGSQGTFTFLASRFTQGSSEGGRIVHVKPQDGLVEATLEGPINPLSTTEQALTLPIILRDAGGDQVEIQIGDDHTVLSVDEWSDWREVRFGVPPLFNVEGMVRLYLVEAFPRPQLYISPINIAPTDPILEISHPADYAGELARRIGLYHTLGMPEETWSLNERRISDDAYLEMVKTVLAEREAMLWDALDDHDNELIVEVFVQTDRVSHMFWRGLDQEHALHAEASDSARGAVQWIYQEADRILGETMQRLSSDDQLVVLSDHGFANFRWAVNLNRWLIDHGYLTLKPGSRDAGPLFDGVDWSRSRAYALGLNGVFLNLAGREQQGIVQENDAQDLLTTLRNDLLAATDPKNARPLFSSIHTSDDIYHGAQQGIAPDLIIGYAPDYRASWQTVLGAAPSDMVTANQDKWSGDHCIDPNHVPGILFTSFPINASVSNITKLPQLILDTLPQQEPPNTAPDDMPKGLFDLANPALNGIKRIFDPWLPPLLQLLLFGAIGGLVSMWIYAKTSAQQKLATIKKDLAESNRALSRYDGEFAGLLPLIGRNYRLASQALLLTLGPAIISSLPLLFLMGWVATQYAALTPQPGDTIRIRVEPVAGTQAPPLLSASPANPLVRTGDGVWTLDWPEPEHAVEIIEADGTRLLTLPLNADINIIHQRRWWNVLFANPLGYLPDRGIVDALHIDLPAQRPLGFGPAWLDAWYSAFFGMLIAVSLFLKRRWRLH